MQSFTQDLKYALRTLTRSPGFTLSVVLVLALGIGATTAIFPLVDATLIRPLPFADPDRLMMIWEDASAMGYPKNNPSPANYSDMRADTRAFEDMAASSMGTWNLTGGGEPIRLEGVRVTANLADVLGVQPVLGRFFSTDEDRDGADPVIVISHGLWQRRFGSDPGIVGTDIVVNDMETTVVGVMPARMPYPSSRTEIWVPMAFSDEERSRRDSHYLRVVGRLRSEVGVEFAQSDLERIATRLEEDYPRTNTDYGLLAEPIQVQYTGDVRSGFLLLLGAVGAVLLIACANIANLLLVRTSGRGKEIAIRAALGAGRVRLIRQMLTESVLLSVTGGIVGMILARASLVLLSALVPAGIAGAVEVEMDLRVMIVGLAVSLTTGLVFGIVPALSVLRVRLNETLQRTSGRVGTSRASRRLRDVLVVGEVALSVALLVGAGLLLRSFASVRNVDPGYRAENVLTVRTDLSFERYAETRRRHGFYREVLERVAALPGVLSVGYTSFVPLTNGGGSLGFTIEGRPESPDGHNPDANFRSISGYIPTMKIRLLAGRIFDGRDRADGTDVAIVNETMAGRFWAGEDPIGKRFKIGGFRSTEAWKTIVGVVGDVRQMGLEVPARPEMYIPMEQFPSSGFFNPRDLVIRTAGAPLALAASVREQVWAVDPNQPISYVRSMEEILDGEVFERRTETLLLGGFSLLALIVASVGLYGVLSYAVSHMKKEIGIRMALGAEQGAVLGMVLRQGMTLAAIGCGVGLALAYVLGGVMSSMLFGVEATDPLTFVSVPLVLVSVALVASLIPARRATKIDPIVALRYE